jgi:processive 1,2-diacylglycerol beta-glucosyltransferase
LRVLVLSSSMGAGHDGAGQELIRRLAAEGHEGRMHDYLDALPLRIGPLIRLNYHLQLRFAPWSYDNSYRMMPRIYGLLVFLNAHLARRRLNRWMAEFPPDVVLSNNPLATLAIGRLRERGQLNVPAVTFITDFGVHSLWIHPGIDLHVTVHPQAAVEAGLRSGGGRASAPGPLVGDRFRSLLPERRLARASLGLAPGERAVLVVAGSWGVGEVEETARLLLDSGRYTPVTVCGRDHRLFARMKAKGLGIVVAWTDQMPTLMAASDVLVENAGGLTSMEAFAAGLPVITFNPIPGHGHDNAAAMAQAGVTRWPETVDELLTTLDEVSVPGPARESLIAAASAMFAGDAAADVLSLVEPRDEPIPLFGPRRRGVVVARRLIGAAAATAAIYGSLTAGVAAAASYGLTVPSSAHPHRNITVAGVPTPVAYLGVRLDPAEVSDPAVQAAVTKLGATVVLTAQTAFEEPGAVQSLAAAGIDVATGGRGRIHTSVLPERLDVSSASAIASVTGIRPSAYIPARPVDALDLLWAGRGHLAIVVPKHRIEPDDALTHLVPGDSYVLDGRLATPAQVTGALADLATTAKGAGTVVTGLRAFE